MDAEARAKAVEILVQAMLQAGVAQDDAERAAPALVDHGAALASTIGGQLDLAADDPQSVTDRLTGTIRGELARATDRLKAAKTAKGEQRAANCAHLAAHLHTALTAGHQLKANIDAHYPDEAAELETVRQTIGLAVAVNGQAKTATTAHLLETTLHAMTHASRHADLMTDAGTPDGDWEFDAGHCEDHVAEAVNHAGKLAEHFRDNYPD